MVDRLLCLFLPCLLGGLASCLPTQTNEHLGPAPEKETSELKEGAVLGSSGVVWEFDLAEMSGQTSQEDLAQLEHIVFKGDVQGECRGLLRIDVLDMSTNDPSAGTGARPLTTLELEQTGPFEILVPRGVATGVGGCCDNDRDGKIMPVVDQFILPVAVTERTAGLGTVLTLGPIPTPGQPPPPPPGGSDKNKPKEAKPAEET